jgi:hypothetical protein
METPGVPPSELRAFLHTCIDGIEHIDILLILRDSDRAWTTREVAAAIRVSEAALIYQKNRDQRCPPSEELRDRDSGGIAAIG